jgi:hypothetical protein
LVAVVTVTIIKGKQEQKRDWDTGAPSLVQVMEFVEDSFKELQREDYQLVNDKYTFSNNESWISWLGSKTEVVVHAESLVRAFSSFKTEDGLSLLDLQGPIEEEDSAFRVSIDRSDLT